MSLKVEVDWNRDGDYSDLSEDVTSFVRPGIGAMSFEYGRDQATALAPTVSGRGSLVLSNRDKRFSPRNTASPLYGLLKPSRPVRVTRTITGLFTPPTLVSYKTTGDWTQVRPTGHVYIVTDVTVEPGDLLLVFASVDSGSRTMSTPSGGGLTYTLQQKPNADDDVSHSDCWLWTTTATTRATFDVTSTFTTAGLKPSGLAVWVWRNATLGNTAGNEAAGTAPSLALTTAFANSAVVTHLSDFNAVSGARTWRSINGVTATEVLYAQAGADQTVYSGYWQDAGAAGSKTVGLTAPTGQMPNVIAAEVQGLPDTRRVLFQGHTDDNPIAVDRDNQTVTLTLLDSLADFRSNNITTQLYSGIRTGTAIGYVLDAVGWPTAARDLDYGATIIPWWWEDNTDALTALEKLIRSEGPPALLTMSETGSIIFRDRHHRLMDAASLTSQQTWRATGGTSQPVIHKQGFSYDEAWRNIVNAGSADIDVRTARETQDVWTSDANFTLTSGESRDLIASSSDPFYDAITPEDAIDFETVAGSVDVELSQLSGGSAIITLTAVGGTAVIRGLKLRAIPVQTAYTVQAKAEDPASITDYGRRSFPGDLPWCSPGDAQAIIETTVGLRAQPVPIVTARFMVARETWQLPLLARDLSDRVTIVEPELNLDDDFFVENISHELTGEHDHAVIFGVELAPAQPTPVFQTDTSGAGADQGYLSNPAINPANLLICDSNIAGHRADEGVAAW